MNRSVWKKKLRPLLRTGLTLCLALLSVMLWRFGLDFAQQIQRSGDIVQYHAVEEGLRKADYDGMVRVESRAREPKSFTLWTQLSRQVLEDPMSGRQAQGPVMLFVGHAQLLLPGVWPLAPEDAQGCVLGKETALQLFGDERAQGAEVLFMEKLYTVRDVTDSPADMLLILAQEDDVLVNVQMQGKDDTEGFALRHGNLVQAPVQVAYFENLSGLFSQLPVLCFLGILIFWLYKLKKSQTAYPLRHTLLLILLFALVTASALYALRLIPGDYVPSRWSDFEHFTQLGQQLKAQTITFFTMEKALPHLQITKLFFGSCLGLLSAALLLIAHARLRRHVRLYLFGDSAAEDMERQEDAAYALWE